MTATTTQANARALGMRLADEIDARTHVRFDPALSYIEGEHGAWTDRTTERVAESLKTAVRTVAAMSCDTAPSASWLVARLTPAQREAALELLLVAADSAAVQLAIAEDAERARAHAEHEAIEDVEAAHVERVAAARAEGVAEGAAEARRAIDDAPPASAAAPRSTVRPRSRRGGRRAA